MRNIYQSGSLNTSKNTVNLFLCSIALVGMLLYERHWIGKYRLLFLIWNVFLAWIPYICSIGAEYFYKENKKIIVLLLGFGWLIFYPNAPYIITDFIHATSNTYIFWKTGEVNRNILVWYELLLLFFTILIGLILGFISLYKIQNIVKHIGGKFISWIFVLIISCLSGFAIYLGRFPRLNSWDVVNPMNLLKIIIKNADLGTMKFSMMFGVFLFLIHFILCGLISTKEYK